MENLFSTAEPSIAALQYQMDPLVPAYAARGTPREELLLATATPILELGKDS